MGYIYLWTGEGGGKTTNALGLALRSLGHGHRVVIIQFMKWWANTGECLFQWNKENMLNHYKYLLIQVGRKGWHGLEKLNEEDIELAHKGLEMVKIVLTAPNPPNLLVLDEINLAVSSGLLTDSEVLEVLKVIPKKTNIVMTGRNAPETFISRVDFVNVITCTKMPKELVSEEGIQW
jgi:cob(I)alamin adenosyltransferase